MPTAFLTGITSGMGRVVMEHCIRAGFDITGIVRNEEKKQALLQEHPNLKLLTCDLAKRDNVKKLANQIKDNHFDYVLLNAGIANVDQFHKLPAESFEDTMEVNLITNMRLVHTLLPNAIPDKTKFIFISSLVARFPGNKFASYATSKAGLSHFYSSLCLEYPKLPMLCIEVGGVATPFHEKANMKLDNSSFKSQDTIGKKIFEAMKTKTGIMTLSLDWYLLRKLGFLVNDAAMPLVRAYFGWQERTHNRSK